MKTLCVLTLTLFSLIEASAQNQDGLPNAQFPFGQPLQLVRQQDRTPKRVFVLGVYASAVHARWISQDGEVFFDSLAVASEPEIFWRGENAADIIRGITVPHEAGRLEPADTAYNGPSGRTLDELYLTPLGLSRTDVWLCDLVPHSLMNSRQRWIIRSRYNPLRKRHNLPTASVPEEPRNLTIDANRRNEIVAELEESQADTIILLGDDPIRCFLSLVSDCKKTRLAQFGKNQEAYGTPITVTINGKTYTVLPLVHVRQAGGLGEHEPEWERLHTYWVENMNRQR